VRAVEAAAAGLFYVDRRPVTPREPVSEPYWPEMQTLPMQCFIDVSDGQRGLAVLNNCFTEYQATDGDETTLAITLFRAVRNIICTEFRSASAFPDQHGGQLRQTLEYNFALLPHGSHCSAADLFRAAQSFAVPPKIVATCPSSAGTMPPSGSLFSLESDVLVLSAFKRAEDRETYVLRLFNPTSDNARGVIRLAAEVRAAWRVSLNEDRLESLPVEARAIEIAAGPHQIVTLEIDTIAP
jgi:mannosylglycerate hydrolase